MNYLDKIKNAMRPSLQEIEVKGINLWIHSPSVRDLPKCDSLNGTIIHCVKDENGDPIFSDTDIDGRVNIEDLDFKIAQEIYSEIIKLTSDNNLDEVEKK